MRFQKYHGLGNDFVLLDGNEFSQSAPTPEAQAEMAANLCRLHYGVGADGLIAVTPFEQSGADFQMTLWNADGGRAEMSGNGIRCAAAFCYRTLGWRSHNIRIQTDAGVVSLRLQSRNGKDFSFGVEIGRPRLAPELIPVNLDFEPPLVDVPLMAGGKEFTATLTSMGNPHCSIFVEELDPQLVAEIGPKIEHHPLFPARTNVEFVKVLSPQRLKVLFWERGVGTTLSSGTGSCGATVAAILRGVAERCVTVETEAGELQVSWLEGGSVVLTGPVCFVFEGTTQD
ncbi:MAG: diaminopimelate epimerase [Blastocatellia bacterium]|nr:diaminopimelate epimerase [Blastocatellia bacterium]